LVKNVSFLFKINKMKLRKLQIKKIRAREILDSRGEPTVEVELTTNFGSFLASAPSGASKGKYEAKELRDGGKRYQGRGVLKAIKNVNEKIFPKIKNRDVQNQERIDQILIKLDRTKNKSKLGANAILPVSMAVCRAGAVAQNLPLYKYISQIYSEFRIQNSEFRIPKLVLTLLMVGFMLETIWRFRNLWLFPNRKALINLFRQLLKFTTLLKES